MRHPDQEQLALYAGGDAGALRTWFLQRHVAACPSCAAEVDGFKAARDTLDGGGELPVGVDWETLAAEMRANIRLGLAASECIAPPYRRTERLGWRAATALAAATAVIVVGWMLQRPQPSMEYVMRAPLALDTADAGVVLAATRSGVEWKQYGRSMTLLAPRPGGSQSESGALVTVNADGSARVRYIDADSGQVTINHVYTE